VSALEAEFRAEKRLPKARHPFQLTLLTRTKGAACP
jgi:hypothetical protein